MTQGICSGSSSLAITPAIRSSLTWVSICVVARSACEQGLDFHEFGAGREERSTRTACSRFLSLKSLRTSLAESSTATWFAPAPTTLAAV